MRPFALVVLIAICIHPAMIFAADTEATYRKAFGLTFCPGAFFYSDAAGVNFYAGARLYPGAFYDAVPGNFFIGMGLFADAMDRGVSAIYKGGAGLETGVGFNIGSLAITPSAMAGGAFAVTRASNADSTEPGVLLNAKLNLSWALSDNFSLGLDLFSWETFLYNLSAAPRAANNWSTLLSVSWDFLAVKRKSVVTATNEIAAIAEAEVVETNYVVVEKVKTNYTKREILIEITKTLSNVEGVSVFDTNDGIVMNLQDILFEYGKADILDAVAKKLDIAAQIIEDYSIMYVIIFGHTDNTGNESDNISLSEQRAKAVSDYIVSRGISADKLSHIGYGGSRPVADNRTEAGRKANRRVEIKFITR